MPHRLLTPLFTLLWLTLSLGLSPAAYSNAFIDDGDRRTLATCVNTPASRAKGLMYRVWLPPYSGMLFVFPEARPRTFWMKNTWVPLDIRFYDADGRLLAHYPYATPCLKEPCPLYKSYTEAQYVLETRAKYRLAQNRNAIEQLIIRRCH
ncbi:DUF192 domain-containing protein [Suttonella sp. R2A3]|uniref:DUF192 domain-containing protein n=1 Tax=Suttonella sp. R2A3 TaxID=2908648 RepID=UPI001F20E051|nr:DUF192 domain-containing protein [Suttonella sp. R2A3]UJF24185.1 DUF192 domain-containing protein [Suttonella sp. R2A3]